jgi:hypothetical protein
MNRKGGRPHTKLINEAQLMQMLTEGKTYQQCADEFGVSLRAVGNAYRRIKDKLKNPPATVDDSKTLDAMGQLADINAAILDQLKRCNKMILREDAKMQACDVISERLAANPADLDAQETLDKIWNANTKTLLAIQTNIINVSGEVRKQIELQLKIAETVYNIQMMQEFQGEIISLLKEVEPILAQKVINKLKETRSIRGLVKM